MTKVEICGVITDGKLKLTAELDALVDLYEVRIDLIGDNWQEIVSRLQKPWIATVRDANQGGKWSGDELQKTNIFLEAVKLGAAIVDIELSSPSLGDIISLLKPKVKCMVSFHDFKLTSSMHELEQVVQRQLAVQADLCKVVTTAKNIADNITLLKLISSFPQTKMIAFAMGDLGILSRVLCPLVGGSFTYASLEEGKESASGQITASALREIYGALIC